MNVVDIADIIFLTWSSLKRRISPVIVKNRNITQIIQSLMILANTGRKDPSIFLEGGEKMNVVEISLRQEIRQMMNEAGVNKNNLKEMVKEVLQEEVEKAIHQAINEKTENFEEYCKKEIDRQLNKELRCAIRDSFSDQLIRKYFGSLQVSVTFPNWEDVEVKNEQTESSMQRLS